MKKVWKRMLKMIENIWEVTTDSFIFEFLYSITIGLWVYFKKSGERKNKE